MKATKLERYWRTTFASYLKQTGALDAFVMPDTGKIILRKLSTARARSVPAEAVFVGRYTAPMPGKMFSDDVLATLDKTPAAIAAITAAVVSVGYVPSPSPLATSAGRRG